MKPNLAQQKQSEMNKLDRNTCLTPTSNTNTNNIRPKTSNSANKHNNLLNSDSDYKQSSQSNIKHDNNVFNSSHMNK